MHDKGFTLIESLVTISILCIVLASALLIIDMDMFYLEKMADEFVTDVRYVQMECMKGDTDTHRINIDIPNKSYHIFKNAAIRKTVVFKERYQIKYSNPNMESVGFTYDGTPVNPGTFTILDTRTNKSKEISIVVASGRTIIKE